MLISAKKRVVCTSPIVHSERYITVYIYIDLLTKDFPEKSKLELKTKTSNGLVRREGVKTPLIQ